MAYARGRQALYDATTSELQSTAIEKEAALESWLNERRYGVTAVANDPHLSADLYNYLSIEPGSNSKQELGQRVQDDLLAHLISFQGYHEFSILDPLTGEIIISTDPREIGKYRENMLYFSEGKKGPYIQNLYYSPSLQAPAMTAAAPILLTQNESDGDPILLGVLTSNLDLDQMNVIIQRRTGLHRTDDAYLVSKSHLFVTQPRSVPDEAVLKRGVHTEAVNQCLAQKSGVIDSKDYLDILSLVAYRWLPGQQLCLIVKLDQEEAFAPVNNLGRTIAVFGLVSFIGATLLAFGLALNISQPIIQLIHGTEEIASGNLQHRIHIHSGDEFDTLGLEFNSMADKLLENETQLRSWGEELEKRVDQRTEELRQSEERYKLATTASNLGIWDWNVEENYIYFTPRWKSMLGFDPDELANDFTTWEQLIHPDERERVMRDLQQFLNQPTEYFINEFRMRHKDGTYLWIYNRAAAVVDEAGKVTRMFGTHTDITKRKQAELSLIIFRQAVESTSDAVGISDSHGKHFYQNTAFSNLFNYSIEEMNQELGGKILYDDQAVGEAVINQIMEGGSWQGEVFASSKDGRKIPISLRADAIRDVDGKIIGLVVIHTDITERKNIEQALKETRDYLEKLLDNASAPIIVWDPEFMITKFNHAFEQLTGYAVGEVIGKKLEFLFPENSKTVSLAIINKATYETNMESIEIPILRKDGVIRTVLWNSANLYSNGDDQVIATIAQGQDITERIVAEQNLVKVNQELERSNSELERFAYVASHDLQEPLRMVTSYLQLLERRYKSQLDEDAIEFINFAVDGSNRMKILINDLLEYSRVGTRGKEFEPTDCNEVLERVLTNLQVTIEESKAQVKVDQLPVILADEGQIEQLFQNLIGNAIKFHGNQPPTVQVSVNGNSKDWIFSVKDNGIGIDPEFFDRIFVIFQRLHNREMYPGTGIGLAISKRIVERHNGEIWVESARGYGSTFYFSIPKEGIHK